MVTYATPPLGVRKAEEDAYSIEKDESSSPKEKMNAYLRAGKGYEETGFTTRAVANYKDALKYAPKGEDKDKIQRKIDSLEPKKISGLRKRLGYAVLSIFSLVFALVFTSFSLTGYSVLELTQNNFRFIGTIFFILGLVFAFVYFKKRKLR